MEMKKNSSKMVFTSAKKTVTQKKVETNKKTSASKKPGAKKRVSNHSVSQKTAANNTINKPKNQASVARKKSVSISAVATLEERQKMISVAAYYISEKRSFSKGSENEDWFQAERQIESLLEANVVS